MDAATLKRAASAVTMGLGGLLWLAAILLMAQTAQHSEQFSRLHPWILAVNIAGLVVLLGLRQDTQLFFEAALLIALLGFVATVALARYLTRGDVIE